jgi:hypothetical protein
MFDDSRFACSFQPRPPTPDLVVTKRAVQSARHRLIGDDIGKPPGWEVTADSYLVWTEGWRFATPI